MARKYRWLGTIASVLVLLLMSDSLLVHALELGTVTGDGISEDIEAYEIDEEEIWAQIDRDELRSLIDVDELRESINTDEYLEQLDIGAIEESISDLNLLDSLDAETILADFKEKEETGELDEIIQEIIESDDFDEDLILNHPDDIPNVTVPIVQENSPFDYILDPCGLVKLTDASKYGGGLVKDDASVLFRNTDSEYTFSDYSDKLTITNMSNIPIQVTISAKIENEGGVVLVDSVSELEGTEPSMYMSLVDNEGLLGVCNSNGSTDINVVLKAAPEGTYKYKLNEETGKYEYELAQKKEDSDYSFDSFSFGLYAACNTEGDWSDIDVLPTIVVTWKTEPILTDWDKVTDGMEPTEKVRYEAYKEACLKELRETEIKRLVQEELDSIIEEELNLIIEAEVDALAQEKFEELRLNAIREKLELEENQQNDSDDELLIIENSDSSEQVVTDEQTDEPEIITQQSPDSGASDEEQLVIIETESEKTED